MPKIIISRTSEQKLIVNQLDHDELLPAYLDVIDFLTKKYEVKEDATFKELVNFKTNRLLPIHSWFDYKQGYAHKLVCRLIEIANLKEDDIILDPFTGVATTQVTAQSKGYKSIGIDINPVAAFAAKVKTHPYTSDELSIISRILEKPLDYKSTQKIPKYKKLNVIFTSTQLNQILMIKGFYENIENKTASDFFKLAYLSIIEDISNRVKDGNGIKISRTKKVIEDVYGFYLTKCNKMLNDIRSIEVQPSARVIQGSILKDEVFNSLQGLPIGAVIYSPPYANCFDYCEVYKMEIWLGDFVDEYADFMRYRKLAIRSHVNSRFSPEIENFNSNVAAVSALIGTYNIWNKNIPAMLKGYFDDMHEVIRRTYQVSKDGALCAIVVANSGYKGVIVPTDLLLAEIAEAVGYKVESILLAREIRASSQQMVELRNQNGLMRESVIILRK
jgi:hypothetical protein